MSQVPKEALESIAKTGRCFTNEAREMAKELLELREKLNTNKNDSVDYFNAYNYIFP